MNNLYRYWLLKIISTCTDFSHEFLRKIRTYMGTDFWVGKIQKWWNFHITIQCYKLILRIAFTLCSNFLHLVTSSQTAVVTQRCYITMLRYSVLLSRKYTCGRGKPRLVRNSRYATSQTKECFLVSARRGMQLSEPAQLPPRKNLQKYFHLFFSLEICTTLWNFSSHFLKS